jgi:hypothetical protein
MNFRPEGCSIYVICLIKNAFLAEYHLLMPVIMQYAEIGRVIVQSSFVFDGIFLDWSQELFAGLYLNHDPPDLCLQRS